MESLCHFCERRHLEVEIPLPHQNLRFYCKLCDGGGSRAVFIQEIREHLQESHDFGSEDLDVDSPDLVRREWIGLPRDLRMIRCRLCQRSFLCQSRYRLLSHVLNRHGIRVDRHVVRYICRCCEEEFSSGKSFENHPCVDLAKTMAASGATDSETTCLYCVQTVPDVEKASHRSRHTNLDFHCEVGSCTRSFNAIKNASDHLKERHELTDAEDVFQSLKMPKDLRSFTCGLCPEVEMFLCQSKEKHLKMQHPGREIQVR